MDCRLINKWEEETNEANSLYARGDIGRAQVIYLSQINRLEHCFREFRSYLSIEVIRLYIISSENLIHLYFQSNEKLLEIKFITKCLNNLIDLMDEPAFTFSDKLEMMRKYNKLYLSYQHITKEIHPAFIRKLERIFYFVPEKNENKMASILEYDS